MSKTIEYARTVLDIEAKAILNLCEQLGLAFEQTVEQILQLKESGRVIVSGMGKASFIGMKLSATLASTGVPSFFLHPAEAVHGDLGRFHRDDLALILSNSGETPEIIRMIPYVKQTGCKLIAITAKSDSTLAKHSDVTITIGELKEAGPLGLAPTTSTTVMLALGDALAMSILNKQNFTRDQFAMYHPGGNLGQMLIPVKDLMRVQNELCIISEDSTVKECLEKIITTKGRAGAAIIVNNQGKLAGIFTDGDLRRQVVKNSNILEFQLKMVMTSNPKSLQSKALAADALAIMSQYKIDELIITNEQNEPVGLIDIQDLVLAKLAN